MANIAQLIAAAESLWPTSGAEDWDRPGLIVGSPDNQVSKVLLSVDVTSELIDDAIAGGYDLVISHHPYLLKGVTSLAEDSLKGSVLSKAIRANVAIYAAHTNADITRTGVSATLANAFGLTDIVPLVATGAGIGHGRVGNLVRPLTLVDFSRLVAKALPATAAGLKVAGNPDSLVTRVALCGGAGDSFISDALSSGADVYVTSDLRHHPTQDAVATPRETGQLSLIDVAHWAAESLWVNAAVQRIESIGTLKVLASAINTDPWTQEVNPNA